ncbi:TolC family protein [Anaeromyxobacter paludicola]|uniref:TolC family protein n=1 Tax=Anaeromyxobacter paludicola TaxID=2918171 RepID=UPI0020C040F4|nr:TolC family protein [Anaeromyxobacter paludicola]
MNAVVAQQELRRVDGLLEQARSGSLPSLAANGTLTRLDGDRRSSTGQLYAARDQQSANVTLTVPLLAPSRWYQWSHASDQLDVARASEADVRRQVTLLAARSYLAVVAQKRVIDVTGRSVSAARAHFEFSRARRQGGVGNALDEARADQQLATAEAQLENAYTALARAQEALGQAAGADEPLDAQAEPELRAPAPQGALEDAQDLRADVRASRERSRAAERVAKDSWADWLPTLLGSAQPFYQHPASLTTPETGWQAQLVLSFPLFEGFLRVGQRHERDALADEARTQLDGLLRQARSDVRVSFEALQHAEQALVAARRAAERANLTLQLATTSYRAGATTNIDVVDAEQRARDADTAAVQAEDAVRQSRLDLLAATGHFP